MARRQAGAGPRARVVTSAGFGQDAGYMEYLHPVLAGMFIR
jgi:hypothetical protein